MSAPQSSPQVDWPSWRLLAVAQQDLQGHHRRTEHWAFVLLSSIPGNREAHVLQLAGNMGTFHFEVLHVPDILQLNALCGGCPVGHIATVGGAEQLRNFLNAQRVVHHDRTWDCQDWLVESVRAMKQEEGDWVEIDPGFSESALRKTLREEKDIWEQADDHWFERLFANN